MYIFVLAWSLEAQGDVGGQTLKFLSRPEDSCVTSCPLREVAKVVALQPPVFFREMMVLISLSHDVASMGMGTKRCPSCGQLTPSVLLRFPPAATQEKGKL